MNALLVVGSPKGKKSTSQAIGGALLRRLAASGWKTSDTTVAAALSSPENLDRFGRDVEAADFILYAFPLYVDQLPTPVIRSLEFLAGRKNNPTGAPADRPAAPKLAIIVQCGFPETHQNNPAVEIMRKFAAAAGFRWAGALAAGMGGAVGNRSLDKPAGPVRNIVKALDLAAASLAAGNDIPEEASALFGKPMMPKFLYTFAANFGMKLQARKFGVKKSVYARPYA